MTGGPLELFGTIAALVLLVPLAVYAPWLVVGGALAAWAGSSLWRRLHRAHTEEGSVA